MTPKEKSENLFGKFYELPMIYATAKDCALIAVDEVLNAVHIAQNDIIEYYKYWEQVKKEIEKL
jgi:hypothetical protein